MNNEQAQALIKVVMKSKMDCWLIVEHGPDGWEAYDLEEHRFITLKHAVEQVVEGMTAYEDYDMTPQEIEAFERLLEDLEIPNPFK